MEPQAPQTLMQMIAPYFPLITPASLLGMAWYARGFVDTFMNNHVHHLQTTATEIKAAIDVQTSTLKAAVDAQTKEMADAFREQRILFSTTAAGKRSR